MAKSSLSNNPTQLLTKARANQTDWNEFGPTIITGTTTGPTKGTIAVDKMWWRRSGDSMDIRVDYHHTSAGVAGSGAYLIDIPTGYLIDTTKVNIGTTIDSYNVAYSKLGTAQIGTGDGNQLAVGTVYGYSSSKIAIITDTKLADAGGTDAGVGENFGSSNGSFANVNVTIKIQATIPILGWSSTAEFLAPQITSAVNLENISVDPTPLSNGSQSLGTVTKAWGSLFFKDTVTSQVYKLEVTNGIFQVVIVP
jgi:hypothetical protein